MDGRKGKEEGGEFSAYEKGKAKRGKEEKRKRGKEEKKKRGRIEMEIDSECPMRQKQANKVTSLNLRRSGEASGVQP